MLSVLVIGFRRGRRSADYVGMTPRLVMVSRGLVLTNWTCQGQIKNKGRLLQLTNAKVAALWRGRSLFTRKQTALNFRLGSQRIAVVFFTVKSAKEFNVLALVSIMTMI